MEEWAPMEVMKWVWKWALIEAVTWVLEWALIAESEWLGELMTLRFGQTPIGEC